MGETVDGNDVVAVYQATERAAKRAAPARGRYCSNSLPIARPAIPGATRATTSPRLSARNGRERDPIERLRRRLKAEAIANEAEIEAYAVASGAAASPRP